MAASRLDYCHWSFLSGHERECGIHGFRDFVCPSLGQFLAQEVCLRGLTPDLEGADNLADKEVSQKRWPPGAARSTHGIQTGELSQKWRPQQN